MFKFDFDIDDAEDTETLNFNDEGPPDTSTKVPEPENVAGPQAFRELSLNELLDALPSLISYSPLPIPLSSSRKSITLLRRDLFDARFQLISGSGDDSEGMKACDSENSLEGNPHDKALSFVDNPSDLVPGIYEGGLKTWECSLDLVDYLDSLKDRVDFQGFCGKKVLELGCGTAVPSLYVFQELLSTYSNDGCFNSQKTEIHLQDYNAFVLQLITMPNLLAIWCASSHSSSCRELVDDPGIGPLIDPTIPGELSITDALKRAFISSLESLNISLRFFVGSWDAFTPELSLTDERTYDLLLTSETIYRLESLRSLIDLMRIACTKSQAMEKSMSSHVNSNLISTIRGDYLCLIATKVLYFGVGGGLADFLGAIQKVGGTLEIVLERKAGVGRKVIRVHW